MLHPLGWPALPVATGGRSGRRVQYAALPYRVRRDGEVQIRLITSRETRRWVIPKGWPMKGLSPPKAAAREAYEEAGLVGVISREPLGMYTYEKRLGSRSVLCDVLVFPLKVKRLLLKWPERFQRYGFWFSIDSAAAAVQEEDLSELIRSFGEIMARRWEEERLEAEQKARAKASKEKPASAASAGERAPEDRLAKDEPAKAKAAGGKPDKAKPGKTKAEKADSGTEVKARSEKAAKAKSGRPVGEPVAARPTVPEPGSESRPAVAPDKAAKGKGGKAPREDAFIPASAVPDAPTSAEADRGATQVAPGLGDGIRKVAVVKEAKKGAPAKGAAKSTPKAPGPPEKPGS